MVLEQIVVLLVDLGLGPICVPILPTELVIHSFLSHLWSSYPFDLYSCLGEISSLGSYLGDIDFSFYF